MQIFNLSNYKILDKEQSNLMIFPLDLGELSILYAVTAMILLVTSEFLSSYNRKNNLLINRKKLKRVAIIFSILFIVTVALRIYEIVLTL